MIAIETAIGILIKKETETGVVSLACTRNDSGHWKCTPNAPTFFLPMVMWQGFPMEMIAQLVKDPSEKDGWHGAGIEITNRT